MGSMVGMIEVDWSEWWLISAIAFVFLMIGGVTGFRAACGAMSLRQGLARAMRNGALAVVLGAIVSAIVVSHVRLWLLGKDTRHRVHMRHPLLDFVSVDQNGIHHGLELDYEGYWNRHSYGCGNCWWTCSPAWCGAESPTELNWIVDKEIARGAVWAFLAPMWIIFGSIPLLGAATVGFSMGAVRRIPAMEG